MMQRDRHTRRLTRSEFKAAMTGLAAQLRAQIEAGVSRFDADALAQAKRVERARRDFRFFVETYFPHYVRHPDVSPFQRYACTTVQAACQAEGHVLHAIAAPRGEAKSTLVTMLGVLWAALTERRRYAVLVMDSFEQAAQKLEAIKAELECNPRLALDFAAACGQGRVWQVGVIVTANGVKIQAAGSGKRLRGLNHGAFRPDLVILDDIENDENVRNPVQRDALEAWLKQTVLPLGAADRPFAVIMVGTVLHYDSVLNRALANPFWRAARFSALPRMPDDMGLWERWEVMLREQGPEPARAFYEAHRAAMERGAVVSWKARDLYTLMTIRARDGHAAFDAEYRNDPVAGEAAVFAQAIHYYTDAEVPERAVMLAAVDPSLGKAGAGRDPSAIVVGAFDRASGVLYIVEASVKKRTPDRLIAEMIEVQRRFRPLLVAVESVQFQAYFRDEAVRQSARAGAPIPAVAVTPHTDKALRIEALQPYMAQGLIRFRPEQTTLIEQFRHFPKADHDDGPDAVEMLWQLATKKLGSATDWAALKVLDPGREWD